LYKNISFFIVKARWRGSLINCQNLIGLWNGVIDEHSVAFIPVARKLGGT
jgi:hypothetical protein